MAFAQDVSGLWKGNLIMEFPEAMRAHMKGNQMPKIKFEMTLRADKTYSGVQTQEGTKQKNTVEGTYKVEGNKVILTPKKRNGKAVTGEDAKSRVYLLGNGGKTLSLDISEQVNAEAKKNGAPATMKMKARIELKKA